MNATETASGAQRVRAGRCCMGLRSVGSCRPVSAGLGGTLSGPTAQPAQADAGSPATATGERPAAGALPARTAPAPPSRPGWTSTSRSSPASGPTAARTGCPWPPWRSPTPTGRPRRRRTRPDGPSNRPARRRRRWPASASASQAAGWSRPAAAVTAHRAGARAAPVQAPLNTVTAASGDRPGGVPVGRGIHCRQIRAGKPASRNRRVSTRVAASTSRCAGQRAAGQARRAAPAGRPRDRAA